MIQIENTLYMTLHEFMEHEDKTFPQFVEAPLFACEDEKKLVKSIIEVNKIQPGYIKYVCSEVNAKYIAELKDIIGKQPVTQRNNPKLYNIITSVTRNLGISMPMIYTYTEEDVYDFNDNSETSSLISDNAFTMGTRDMLYVFVSDSIIEGNKLTDDEIAALIGHEIGHALANHQVYSQVFLRRIVNNKATVAAIKWDEINGLYKSNRFSRINEFTADRAALLASRNIEAVEGLLRKISEDGGWEYDHSNSTHPNGKSRVEAIKLFASSMLYIQCVEHIDNTEIEKNTSSLTNKQLDEGIKRLL